MHQTLEMVGRVFQAIIYSELRKKTDTQLKQLAIIGRKK